MNHQEERGFALVMTMAVLTGMLIIIVPLVTINNLKYSEAKVAEAEALSRYGIDSARNLTQFINQRNGGRDISGFAKTVVLPGWRDIPLLLHGSGTNTVANFVPAFLMMATPLGKVGTNCHHNGDLSHKFEREFRDLLPGVNLTNDIWFVVGGELMSRNERGLMGHLTSHKARESVFAVPIESFKQCWVKINGKWGQIERIKYNKDLSAELYLTNGLTINHNDTVEFYPVRIHNRYDHNVDLDIRVRVVDERSKFNVASMTHEMSKTLGLNMDINRSLPYVSPITLRADGVNAEKIIDVMPLITSYSSPDYTSINKAGDDGIYGEREVYNGVPQVNGKRIFQHPINVNTASLNVLGNVFIAMNVDKPYEIAQDIVDYRSGGGGNFNGNENPFDGFRPNYAEGGEKYFASIEEEFADFISKKASQSDTYKILQHVYAYGNLAEYKSLGKKSVPLCFQMDHVQTANISARVMSGKRPLIEEKSTVVSREIYHDMENSTRGRITLDSDNGWNIGMSTFYGIEWRQPQIKKMNENKETITFDYKYHKNGNSWSASPSIGPGLLGRVSFRYSTKVKYITKYDSDSVTVKAKQLPSDGVNRLDFGLRVITRPDHIKKIDKVTITGNQDQFSVDPANQFIKNDVQGKFFIYVPPGDGDPKLIDYTGANNNYHSTTEFEVEPGHKAYVQPKYGFNDNQNMYPNTEVGQVPFYETVIIRENAIWDYIRWDTLEKGPKITKVFINGTEYQQEEGFDRGGEGIWAYHVNNLHDKGITNKYLRLRFEFSDTENRDRKHIGGCPQLFRIVVTYSLPDDKPRRIVLDQR